MLASCTALGSGGDIEGTWLYESYIENGESVDVEVDVNASEEPYVTIEDGQLNGVAGCNGFSGDFTYTDGELTPGEIFSELALCMPETLMGSELALHDVISSGAAVAVSIEGDTMRWQRGGEVLTFTRTDEPPPEPTIQPQTSFGPLDCGEDEVVTEDVPSDGTTAEEVAFEADDRVAVVTAEGDQGHFATGVDTDGNVVLVVAFQDVDPFPYRIYSCP